VQTIDVGPTLLEYFGLPLTPDMHGVPLADTVATDRAVRGGALFGNHGGHVNLTDGRYVYLRACADPANQPLEEYTLMPTHMASRFTADELRAVELAEPFAFTKGVPVLRVPGAAWGNPHHFGTLLFDLDLDHDPEQQHPLVDDAVELRMATLMTELMRRDDAPLSQFERMGLPGHRRGRPRAPAGPRATRTGLPLPRPAGAPRRLPYGRAGSADPHRRTPRRPAQP